MCFGEYVTDDSYLWRCTEFSLNITCPLMWKYCFTLWNVFSVLEVRSRRLFIVSAWRNWLSAAYCIKEYRFNLPARSLAQRLNESGSSTEPCATPISSLNLLFRVPFRRTVCSILQLVLGPEVVNIELSTLMYVKESHG